MLTKLIEYGPEAVELAAALLRAGGLVGLPTETVYGLAANALDPAAVRRVFEAKGRPQDNPLIAHIASMRQLHELCADIPEAALALADRFWPGPLTLVLRHSGIAADEVTAGLDTIAVRMPAHPAARAVIEAAGLPLAAPSANISGRPSTTTAAHVARDLAGGIPLIIDGGPCGVGLESTVISLAGAPVILRLGGLPREAIEGAIGPVDVAEEADGDAPRAPGMKYRHYAPRAPLVVVDSPDAVRRICGYVDADRLAGRGACVLCFDGERELYPCAAVAYGREDRPETLMRGLFAALRELDDLGCDVIYARCPARAPATEALLNRLDKACGGLGNGT